MENRWTDDDLNRMLATDLQAQATAGVTLASEAAGTMAVRTDEARSPLRLVVSEDVTPDENSEYESLTRIAPFAWPTVSEWLFIAACAAGAIAFCYVVLGMAGGGR